MERIHGKNGGPSPDTTRCNVHAAPLGSPAAIAADSAVRRAPGSQPADGSRSRPSRSVVISRSDSMGAKLNVHDRILTGPAGGDCDHKADTRTSFDGIAGRTRSTASRGPAVRWGPVHRVTSPFDDVACGGAMKLDLHLVFEPRVVLPQDRYDLGLRELLRNRLAL